MAGVLIRREEDTDKPGKDRSRDWSDAAVNQGHQKLGAARKDTPGALRESMALLTHRVQASRLQTREGINSCCFKATWFVLLCYCSSGKLIEDLKEIDVQGMTVTFK